ncbi:GNAT family N-acetyltransferase [Nocardia noduli]|uniref:GNAT family N-acetyltransferase n=1 Tax=Nocardia noduli TaxID=2815722 RepID=UPI001C215912|nr:GNAT family N-acetyltransferase [Nocardia noduli]
MPAQHATRPARDATERPNPRIAVRSVDSESELHRFVGWSHESGVGDPEFLVDQLLGFHRNGLLGVAPDPTPHTIQEILDSHGVPSAAATRTTVAVAVLDGQLAGGIIAGPSIWLLTRVLANNPDQLLPALLRTVEIQVLAVADQHRRRGVGTALVRAALAAAQTMKAHVLHGQILDDPSLASFYRGCGLTVHRPGIGIDFTELAAIDLTVTIDDEQRFLTHVLR